MADAGGETDRFEQLSGGLVDGSDQAAILPVPSPRDNLSTHTTPEVCAWLDENPHVAFPFTPTGSSWMNMVEAWFGIITRQSINTRRVSPKSGLQEWVRTSRIRV